MIRLFRFVAFIEGITTLMLFLVAMPLKYGFGNAVLIPSFGLAHGVAFLAYAAVMIFTLALIGAPWLAWPRCFIASLFPFGTFLNDPYVARLGATP